MTDSDLTLSILREIRDTVARLEQSHARTNAHLDETNARLDETNARLHETNARLDKGFQRVVSILKHHDAQVIFLGRYLKNRTEKEIRDLGTRVAKLERKVS